MVDEVIPDLDLDEEGKSKFRMAADKWRLPFWDWAKNPSMPKLLCWRTIQIPFLNSTTIQNPLYQFRMPGGAKMGDYGVMILQARDLEDALEVCVSKLRHFVRSRID